MPKSTPAQRKALRDIDYRIAKAESITKIVTTAIRYGVFAYIAWTLRGAVEALAGRITLADINVAVRILMSEKLDELLAWSVGVVGIFYGWRQRKFRKDDIERRSERIAQLERML